MFKLIIAGGMDFQKSSNTFTHIDKLLNKHFKGVAIIYHDKVKVYFNREYEGKTASCFKDCIVYDKEK